MIGITMFLVRFSLVFRCSFVCCFVMSNITGEINMIITELMSVSTCYRGRVQM